MNLDLKDPDSIVAWWKVYRWPPTRANQEGVRV